MIKVITYGTYDLLHEGHIKLLERAKALGDYLIVGVTADGFDKARGKINVQQSLIERIEAVKKTGLADKIIIEEYEGQKIDDIRRYGADIFTVGSDWKGKFDYLNEFCKVIYLDRTKGVSSTQIRSDKKPLRIGIIGESRVANKFFNESKYVNGVTISGICAEDYSEITDELINISCDSIDHLLDNSDAVYIASLPQHHYEQAKLALEKGLHVLCESPIALNVTHFDELAKLANDKKLILMDGVKTAYSLAFSRLILLVKSGIIGEVLSVDTTCTSLIDIDKEGSISSPYTWNSLCWWGPNAILPILDIFGSEYRSAILSSKVLSSDSSFDLFTQGFLIFNNGVATFKVGQGVKSEGEMVISGTKGYIYVPAPWWKTDYFEIRYENQSENKRHFYQLEGEGIRNEIRTFQRLINGEEGLEQINESVSRSMISIIEKFYNGDYLRLR